ncbi:hypothetical protein BDQ12DRAFT_740065 [Crucibulum laeve]|uniref:Uncharacterized protein n=1 Tax=Crucibulum laeve TaxID=68775 RepID=A0A5C3LRK7_9AGAR|nr:hypothetical protein BDQ12DRAFT_740065 [Crucibulum laeve]
MRRFFHPNIARLLGVSPCSANAPYIVYQGGASTCRIQALIAKNLRTKLELGTVSSLRFAKGVAAAISYLQNQGISLQYLAAGGSFENLDVLAGEDGEAVLTMSAGVVDNSSNVPLSSSTMVTSEDGWKFFNDLCQQTLQEVNYILHQDNPHRILSRGDLSHATQSTELNTSELQMTSPLTVSFPEQSKTRREVRWEADADFPQPLDILAQRFQDDIDSCGTSLRRLTVPNSWLPVWHQCTGYLREEINLCADLSRSAVLTYAAPTPNERCTICGELVLSLEFDLERDFGQWFTRDYGRDEGEIDLEENFDHFMEEDFDYFDQLPTRALLDA